MAKLIYDNGILKEIEFTPKEWQDYMKNSFLKVAKKEDEK